MAPVTRLLVRSATQFVKSSFRFIITETGKVRAGELLDICHYAGRAPVTLDAYREMVECQSIRNIFVDEKAAREAFSEIVISDQLVHRIGPAISSGAPIFVITSYSIHYTKLYDRRGRRCGCAGSGSCRRPS